VINIAQETVKFISSEGIGNDIFRVEVQKATADFANNCLLGGHVLAKSKRIMNEVMCLAYDLGCRIFYQDTDSFFIAIEDLPKLEVEYKKVYHRELMGEDLGQFHHDFKSMDGRKNVECDSESYFIQKKTYCCKLLMKDGSENITYRAKGFNLKAIQKEAIRRNPQMNNVEAILQFYKDIYNGERIKLDNTDGGVIFKYNSKFEVKTLPSMVRTLQRNT
jgi:hypothetical protein